ncbi:MAG: sigma-54-dependent transcriptional regulator [Candidatus Rokuibacteriota bacterium]
MADVRPVVLVVDDEPGVRASVKVILEGEYEVLEAGDGPAALELVKMRTVDVCLLDIRLPGMEGITVLQRLKRLDGGLEVVLVTAVRTLRTAVEAMKLGAYDYLTKPFGVDDLRVLVRRALERRALQREVTYLRGELARHEGADPLVGHSPKMRRLHELIRQVAGTTATVLISGESGTGKELIARAIHRQGRRRDRPFVTVNCGALPPELMESELFGHERGSFTGAHARKLGKFELAQAGTLFLDEVATLRVDLQPKLLRVIQEREIERVGGTRSVKVDVRFIAATNVDLRQAIAGGQFREDLFYRLNVVPIAVPSLRERREDIPVLVDHFLAKYRQQFGKPVTDVSPVAMELLQQYHWPGNVRELENIIERSVALAPDKVLQLADIPLDLALVPGRTPWDDRLTLREARQEFERQLILRTLDRAEGNQTVAARRLGMHRNTLLTKMVQLGLRTADAAGESLDEPSEET